MALVGIVPVIIYAHCQYLARISFQRLGVMPVLYLLYGRIDCLVIFQLYDKGRRSEERRVGKECRL